MKRESGQALVLVLLSLAVVLTLVLFILARSVTDIAVSTSSEESVRAFSAAEAGIEQALIIGSGTTSTVGNATFTSSVTNVASGAQNFTYPISLAAGDTATLWFVNHDSTGATVCDGTNPCFTGHLVKVCWGKQGTSANTATTPAVEFSVFYESTPGTLSTARIARISIDPNSSRATTTRFVAPDSGSCSTAGGETLQFQKTIDLATLGIPAGSYGVQNGLQYAKLRMLYNSDTNHKAGFDVNLGGGNTLLPSQGIQADSTGTAGASNRRLSVFQSWPEAPIIFDFALYSSTGISK